MAKAPPRSAPDRRRPAWKAAPAHFWAWLTGTGYRPERRYMRGGRPPAAAGSRR